MKQKKCPSKLFCHDYGNCEGCTWNAVLQEKEELERYFARAIFYLTGAADKGAVKRWIREEKRKDKRENGRKT